MHKGEAISWLVKLSVMLHRISSYIVAYMSKSYSDFVAAVRASYREMY